MQIDQSRLGDDLQSRAVVDRADVVVFVQQMAGIVGMAECLERVAVSRRDRRSR